VNNESIEKDKGVKGIMLKSLIIITFIMMFATFNISLYLLVEIQTVEGLQVIVCFIAAQIIGFIVLLVILAFFSAHYEYNEYWASAMWKDLLRIEGQCKKIEKRLIDLLPLLESKNEEAITLTEAQSKKEQCNHHLDQPEYHPCKDCPLNGKKECPYEDS